MAIVEYASSGKGVEHFSAFTNNDPDSDDEEDIVRALSAMTASVNLASEKRMSQKSKKDRAKNKNLSHLNAIARKVNSGEISMPEIDLDHNEHFDYVWAMVDSGAGAIVA